MVATGPATSVDPHACRAHRPQMPPRQVRVPPVAVGLRAPRQKRAATGVWPRRPAMRPPQMAGHATGVPPVLARNGPVTTGVTARLVAPARHASQEVVPTGRHAVLVARNKAPSSQTRPRPVGGPARVVRAGVATNVGLRPGRASGTVVGQTPAVATSIGLARVTARWTVPPRHPEGPGAS